MNEYEQNKVEYYTQSVRAWYETKLCATRYIAITSLVLSIVVIGILLTNYNNIPHDYCVTCLLLLFVSLITSIVVMELKGKRIENLINGDNSGMPILLLFDTINKIIFIFAIIYTFVLVI
jgi:hypothetical protein